MITLSDIANAPMRWKVACGAAALVCGLAIGGGVSALTLIKRGDISLSLTRVATAKAEIEAPGKAVASQVPSEASSTPISLGSLSLLPPPVAAPPRPVTLVLNADLGTQRLTMIEDGKVKHTWPISSGRDGFATKTGTFKPQWASKLWYSRQYDNAPMPHAVFFHGGMAFHATTATGMLGRRASHGCIRLSPANAAALFKLVHKHTFAGTKIVVHNGQKAGPAVAAKKPVARRAESARGTPRT
jgi:lipoprotein-anchoring transpeptidase ErfK/SrfK